MRIAFIINSLNHRGGAEVFVTSLYKAFYNDKNNSYCFITIFSKMHPSFNEIRNLNYYSCNKSKHIDYSASRKLKEILIDFKPDILSVHLPFFVTYFCAFGFKKMPWKIVKTFHSIPGKDSNIFETSLSKLYLKKKEISFVGISDKITKKAEKYFKIDSKQIVTIYNGVNLVEARSSKEKRFDLVICATFSQVKNHELLLRAISSLKSEDINLVVACVGDGDTLSSCRLLVKSLDIESNVLFLGQLDDVNPILVDSKYFILTSKREGNPISILEAMNVGLPIIAPSVGGIPDIVKNNENGFLFEVDNLNDLVNAIKSALKCEYQRISENNIKEVKKYDIKRTKCEYERYFKILLEGEK